MSVKVKRTVTITCDHPGCDKMGIGVDGQDEASIRAELETLGWRSFGSKDFCRNHVPPYPPGITP